MSIPPPPVELGDSKDWYDWNTETANYIQFMVERCQKYAPLKKRFK